MKKIIVLFSILVLVSSAFAQNPKSTGLTDSDVKSWAKNLKSIEREFDDAGISRDDVKSASKGRIHSPKVRHFRTKSHRKARNDQPVRNACYGRKRLCRRRH